MQRFSTEPVKAGKIALGVEYDGSHYHGWQIQRKPAVATVQAEVTTAIQHIANESVNVYCAGRTDAGVHATNQVIHFETQAIRSESAWIKGVNAKLSDAVAIKWMKPLDGDFHARFSARSRTYCYVIYNAVNRSPLLHNRVTRIDVPLNADAMHQAGQYLLGENDFTGYRAAGCQSGSSHRCVDYLTVTRRGDFIMMEIRANAFLLHMVRNIMGVLLDIGSGLKPAIWAKEILVGKDRQQAGKTAPASGLYLIGVAYDQIHGLPDSPVTPDF